MANKEQVLEELKALSEWMRQRDRLAPAKKNEGEFAASRIDNVVGWIERYVDAKCTSAWIG